MTKEKYIDSIKTPYRDLDVSVGTLEIAFFKWHKAKGKNGRYAYFGAYRNPTKTFAIKGKTYGEMLYYEDTGKINWE